MPREIRFEAIPKTSTGKIQKFQLRERARSAAAIDQEQTMTETAAGESAPFVRRDVDGRGVVRLTLNRPQAFNALSSGMLAALQAELDAVAADESARVVVIAAEGKAFSAGHDLKQMRAEPSLGLLRGAVRAVRADDGRRSSACRCR